MNGRDGRGPSHSVPVEPLRRVGVGREADPGGGHVAGVAGPRRRHLADGPGAHQLGELRVQARRPPLRADLDDAVVPPRRLDDPPALAHGHRQRLLDIDVLPRGAGHRRLDRVPVVRRGDDHGVDVLAVEQAAEVLDPLDRPAEVGLSRGDALAQVLEAGVDPVVRPVEVGLVDVGQGDDLRIGMGAEGVQDLDAAVAHADAAEVHPIIGPDDPARRRRGRDRARRGRRQCRPGKVTPTHSVLHHAGLPEHPRVWAHSCTRWHVSSHLFRLPWRASRWYGRWTNVRQMVRSRGESGAEGAS